MLLDTHALPMSAHLLLSYQPFNKQGSWAISLVEGCQDQLHWLEAQCVISASSPIGWRSATFPRSFVEVINLMLTMLDVNQSSLPGEDFRIVSWQTGSTEQIQIFSLLIFAGHEVKMAQQVENDYIGSSS